VHSDQPDVLATQARQAFVAGDAAAAAKLLARAAELKPDAVEYHANLGMVLANLGRIDEAVAAFRRALALNPNSPEVLNNLGAALRDKKQLDEAVALFGQALALRAEYPECLYNLGVALQEQGKLEEAISVFQRVIALRPDFARAYNNLGLILFKRERISEADLAYRRAVELKGDSADAWHGLGCVCQQMGKRAEAVGHYQRALALRPDLADAHYNLGHIARDEGREEEAIAHYTAAWSLQPDLIEAPNNLALLLAKRERWDEAVEVLRDALRAQPGFATTHNNLGHVLQDMGRHGDAIAAYDKAIQLQSDYADAEFNRGLLLLANGQLPEGWRGYEARLRVPGHVADRDYAQPPWDGSELAGRTILLHAEQGYGDTIQFIRYAPLAAARGGRVLLVCPRGLHRLIEGRLGIEHVFATHDPLPAFDVHCPLPSLPERFGTTIETIPSQIPYLGADETLEMRWRERMSREPGGLKVGLAWAGNPAHPKDRHRSVPMSGLAPLSEAASEVRFVSLQVGQGADQSRFAPFDLLDWTGELTDFADTAALVANLDLVIAADTAVVHLAGAMGKPMWVLLGLPTDWRWMLGREDSPWYPTARLFRQSARGDWESVLNRVAEELNSFKAESWNRRFFA
jgi:tetratricopeptide (TPR) repeat protein